MSKTVYDVLLNIFDNYVTADLTLDREEDVVINELRRLGFPKALVEKAFNWLKKLDRETSKLSQSAEQGARQMVRIFCPEENDKLLPESQGLLHSLVNVGLLDMTTREKIIELAMELGTQKIDDEQIKWVTLMVLFSQSDALDLEQLDWLEQLVFDENFETVH